MKNISKYLTVAVTVAVLSITTSGLSWAHNTFYVPKKNARTQPVKALPHTKTSPVTHHITQRLRKKDDSFSHLNR